MAHIVDVLGNQSLIGLSRPELPGRVSEERYHSAAENLNRHQQDELELCQPVSLAKLGRSRADIEQHGAHEDEVNEK